MDYELTFFGCRSKAGGRMATKREELELAAHGKGSLGKAADDEPIFILRGQDLFAPQLVERWARSARRSGCPQHKVDEALRLAEAMRRWGDEYGKYPD